MGFKIVRTTTRHLKAIHALEKECFSDPWSIQSLKHDVTHPQSVCFSAIDASEIFSSKKASLLQRLFSRFTTKKILGHVIMLYVLDEGNINNIAVTKAARRQGIGRRLIEAVMSEANSLGITSLTLEVRSKNHAAISLYEKLGFVTIAHRKDYYRKPKDDALVMWKGEPQRCAKRTRTLLRSESVRHIYDANAN